MPDAPRFRLALTAGLLLALVMIAALLALAGTGQERLLETITTIERQVDEHLALVIFIYVLGFTVLVTLGLPVGTLMCLAGGYLFGAVIGFSAAMAGACLGAVVTFALIRRFGGRNFRRHYSSGRIAAILQSIERNATWYLVLLRMVPVAPFFAVNAAAGATAIGLHHFVVATAAGLVPTTLIYVTVGAGLHSIIEARDMLGPQLLLEPHIGLPLLGLIAIIVASWVVRARLRKQNPAL